MKQILKIHQNEEDPDGKKILFSSTSLTRGFLHEVIELSIGIEKNSDFINQVDDRWQSCSDSTSLKDIVDNDVSKDFNLEIAKISKSFDKPDKLINLVVNYSDNAQEVEEHLERLLLDLENHLDKIPEHHVLEFSSELIQRQARVKLHFERVFTQELTNKNSLRHEVTQLIQRKKQGKIAIEPYVRGKWKSPLIYLEDKYGKYLAKYNKNKTDYIYINEIRQIDLKFYNTLYRYLSRRKESIDTYVPTNSMRLDKKASTVKAEEIDTFNKIRSLKDSGRL